MPRDILIGRDKTQPYDFPIIDVNASNASNSLFPPILLHSIDIHLKILEGTVFSLEKLSAIPRYHRVAPISEGRLCHISAMQ